MPRGLTQYSSATVSDITVYKHDACTYLYYTFVYILVKIESKLSVQNVLIINN